MLRGRLGLETARIPHADRHGLWWLSRGALTVLNDSDQVIVMVDEAHRTQYGMLGAKLSQALPNAVLVGFTGTPIDQGFERSTMRHFGPLIDAYTIPQSVADGGDGTHMVRGPAARSGDPGTRNAGQTVRCPIS